ncbi:hypothetical protein FHR32_007382 [Streptosporangium album]|uniref:Radical SAM core domain-containing protein n=1 Tax=Streptosporangium album TaxID=47479 RepID=A0A7W7S3T7_9ACTN|nr:hypothetical protein [Streptosporangium album]MBB4942982.1 hypothetical protein [Streptosporangium album]
MPSPVTSGVFEEGRYTTAILETNRGCPFSCGFCFWGAATNDKVHKFEDRRVRDDITWISKNNFVSIFIADASWGMAPRDVELTRHLVKCSEENGYPVMVAMAAAKNKPDRMAEITEIPGPRRCSGLMRCVWWARSLGAGCQTSTTSDDLSGL